MGVGKCNAMKANVRKSKDMAAKKKHAGSRDESCTSRNGKGTEMLQELQYLGAKREVDIVMAGRSGSEKSSRNQKISSAKV